ncbi:MAG: class I SAM-dependent methyltransferase [Candidatus Binatia bacterium]
MRVSKVFLVCQLAFFIAITLATSPGHAQSARGYEPRVGQAGKDVVWVPTPDELVEKMLNLGNVTASDYVIDLGSGDGRTVIMAAKRGARAHGIEYNPEMVELSTQNAAKAGVSERATFAKEDLFESDFSKASVITMFLLPQINLKLRPKILDLKPGTRIVSNSFTMGEWREDGSDSLDSECVNWCTALLWIVPAKVAGTWKLAQGELTLQQSYQFISGTLKVGNDVTPIANGKLKGDQILFNAGGVVYAGQVSGGSMQGTLSSGGTWSASRGK